MRWKWGFLIILQNTSFLLQYHPAYLQIKLEAANLDYFLTLSWRRSLSYRNQFIDLLGKSMDWFLYDKDLHHERVKLAMHKLLTLSYIMLKNGQTFLKHFVVWKCKIFKVCLAIFQYYAWKGKVKSKKILLKEFVRIIFWHVNSCTFN